MSKTSNTRSTKVHDDQSTDSVYDFLYYDAARVASFLSQFDNYGHLTQIVRGEQASRSQKKTDNIEGTIGVPLTAQAKGNFNQETSSTGGQDNRRTYDPTWANVLEFLDQLSERNLLQRDLDKAGVGQFVLASGSLDVTDLQIFEKTWKSKSVEKMIRAGAPKPSKGTTPSEVDLFFDLLSVLPHTIQANLNGEHSVWSTLAHQWLTMTSSDLLLAHGANVPGVWNIVGILDARPDPLFSLGSAPAVDMSDAAEMGIKLMKLISPIARGMLGRPALSFSVTPLAIFREISR